jgi:hypothetical protein
VKWMTGRMDGREKGRQRRGEERRGEEDGLTVEVVGDAPRVFGTVRGDFTRIGHGDSELPSVGARSEEGNDGGGGELHDENLVVVLFDVVVVGVMDGRSGRWKCAEENSLYIS